MQERVAAEAPDPDATAAGALLAPEVKKKPTRLSSLPGGEGNNMGLGLSFQWVVDDDHWRLQG